MGINRVRTDEEVFGNFPAGFAAGEMAESVPRSAAEDGHRVVGMEPLGAGQGFRLVLAKRGRGGEAWR